MCAYFRATGEHFDVDRFLEGSCLVPDRVFHRGEPKIKLKGRTWPYSGFGLEAGGDFGRLRSQGIEAEKFLKECRQELRRLVVFPGVSDLRLIFSYCPGNSANVTEYFSPGMLEELGPARIGIELDVYPGSNEWLSQECGGGSD
jgi:hypothetical protein